MLDLIVLTLAVIVVTMAVTLRGATSGGLLGVALINILSLNQALSILVTSWTSLETSLGAIARIKTFSEITPNENGPGKSHSPPEAWPQCGGGFASTMSRLLIPMEPSLSATSI